MYVLRICFALLVLCVVLAVGRRRGHSRRGSGPPLPSPAHLCPFGGSLDTEMDPNDDGNSGRLRIPRFPFFGRRYRSLYVNTNGLISFNQPNADYTPEWFPQTRDILIAPYWADADTRLNEGRVYYRESKGVPCITKLSEIVQKAFKNDFQATWLFFATWHRVTFYRRDNTASFRPPVNTFQTILVTNGRESYVVFNYGDIAWTTGEASGGDENGLGGTPAEVGFNAGDGTRYYTQFGSLTPDIIDIRTKTNCNTRGRFVFRVDGREILSPQPTLYGYFRGDVSRSRSAMRGKPTGKKPEAPAAA
ncbi:hypothetical protein NP493_718g04022 [Ridgeia piscesae]|uniref:NIDO domain-containing protein n=1 Tax=Ridgeia piscesae TaxID=27915 RepID=A0AAD9KQ65_RIDPI|nr:hypothetical protein NP493_718g04022 [Ridgeia piscesae]